jgi:hypothetical protein
MYHSYDSILTSIPCIRPHAYETYLSVDSMQTYIAFSLHYTEKYTISLQYTDSYTIHLVVYRQEHRSVGSIYSDMYAIRSSVYRQVSHWLGCIQASVIHLAV